MASVIRVQDVIDEMDTLSSEHHAYLNRQTGDTNLNDVSDR